jgi:hypothetical protein
MSDLLKDGHLHAVIRRLDELLAEAVRLRADIASAMRRRRERPFWPDRRLGRQPHDPDRRVA